MKIKKNIILIQKNKGRTFNIEISIYSTVLKLINNLNLKFNKNRLLNY